MSKLLMGSGGGSGACSNDPSKNPPGIILLSFLTIHY